MTYVCWTMDEGLPRILGLRNKVFASLGTVHYHTRKEFEKIVGTEEANAALEQYFIEKEHLHQKFRSLLPADPKFKAIDYLDEEHIRERNLYYRFLGQRAA